MPRHALAAPSRITSPPHHAGPGGSQAKPRRTRPYAPSATITADMSAETTDAATGWARGSHTWNGTMPALVPKPTSPSTKTSDAVPGSSVEAAAVQSVKANEPLWRASRRNATVRTAGAGGALTREPQPRGPPPPRARTPATRAHD